MNFPGNDPVSSSRLKEIDEVLILFESFVNIEFKQWIWILKLESDFDFDEKLIWIRSPIKFHFQWNGYKNRVDFVNLVLGPQEGYGQTLLGQW